MKTVAFVVLSVLVAVLVLVPDSQAGGYRSCYSASYSYAPTYATSHVAPTYTPTYAVPTYIKAVKAYVSPDYYSSVTDYYRDKLLVDAVAGRTAELMKGQQELQSLRDEVTLLRRQLLLGREPVIPQSSPVPQAQPQPQAAPQAQPMPRVEAGLPPVPDKLAALVQQSCLRCHGATNERTGGGINLSDLAAVPRAVRLACKAAVDDGYMPRGGKPLDDTAAVLFHEWSTGRKAQQAQK